MTVNYQQTGHAVEHVQISRPSAPLALTYICTIPYRASGLPANEMQLLLSTILYVWANEVNKFLHERSGHHLKAQVVLENGNSKLPGWFGNW